MKCPNCGKEGEPLGKNRANPDLYKGEYFCRECSIQYKKNDYISPEKYGKDESAPSHTFETKKEEKELLRGESASDIILLESSYAKLTKERFIWGFGRKEQILLISDIRRASLSSGFFSLPKLVLEFKNGTEKEFVVGTASGLSRFTDLMSGMSNQADQDMKNSTQQWVTTINMLLAMR